MSGRAEVFRALGALVEPPEPAHEAIAAGLGIGLMPAPGDYADAFLFNAYPYASVYLGIEGMLGGEARDRVAGFWRALRLTPPAEPDHLAALLGLYAALIDAEEKAGREGDPARAVMRRESRKALLWEHLLSWLPAYLDKVLELASPYYVAWAALLRDTLISEGTELGQPGELPLHLRAAEGLPDVDAAGGEWVGALLAAVRSGMIVTRWDLRRAASDLGIGVRAGERAFMLRSLLEQDAAGTARWLADAARRAASAHRPSERPLGSIGAFWRARAEASAAALELAAAGGAKPTGTVGAPVA